MFVRIVATADVHSPRYLDEFRISLSTCEQPDLILLAGDIINFGKVHEYKNIIDIIDSQFGEMIPIVACFGNEEHEDVRDEILALVGKRIQFLNESATKIDLHGITVGIVGAPTLVNRGKSDDGTIEDIREVFENRMRRISELLSQVSRDSTYTVLLVHYSPLRSHKTGQDNRTFSWWISKTIEKVQPNLVVHGHLHNSRRQEVTIGQTRIINVAFPAVKRVTEIQL